MCFDRVELSSGGWFFFRCSSFLRDNLCSHKSFFLFDQVFCSALVSLPPCLLESFTHNSGWHRLEDYFTIPAVVLIVFAAVCAFVCVITEGAGCVLCILAVAEIAIGALIVCEVLCLKGYAFRGCTS